jgi:hypothetical protein
MLIYEICWVSQLHELYGTELVSISPWLWCEFGNAPEEVFHGQFDGKANHML